MLSCHNHFELIYVLQLSGIYVCVHYAQEFYGSLLLFNLSPKAIIKGCATWLSFVIKIFNESLQLCWHLANERIKVRLCRYRSGRLLFIITVFIILWLYDLTRCADRFAFILYDSEGLSWVCLAAFGPEPLLVHFLFTINDYNQGYFSKTQ